MSKWREASSLILTVANKNVSRIPEVEKRTNFKILALNKNETANKPQICVFPGGSLSQADSVKEWEGLFSSFGLNLGNLSNSLLNSSTTNLPIFDKRGEYIPRWLSLRISAIRETFEECGILLCRQQSTSADIGPREVLESSTKHFPISQIESWRDKVLDDPFEFISLCRQNKCYPDIESLFLWSNWLAPSHLPDRFDAVFFLANINSLSTFKGSPDFKEIASTEWLHPEELLDLSNNGEILLKPPQWYEITTLLKVGDIDKLKECSLKRSYQCRQWMPVRVATLDGEVTLLPGDEMYPSKVDYFERSPLRHEQKNMTALRCKRMHRMEHLGIKTFLLDTISN